MKTSRTAWTQRLWLLWGGALLALGGQGADARSLADILKTRELRVCLFADSPAIASAEPPDCRQHCKFSGPVVDESLAFARSLGPDVRVKWHRVQWDEQFFNQAGQVVYEASYTPELLASRQCDLYPNNLTKTAWRSRKLDFVVLFPSRMMVIAHQSQRNTLRTEAQLAGKSAATTKDTAYHTWLAQQNQGPFAANPVRIALMSTNDTLAAVDAGMVDFTLADADLAIWSTRHRLKQSAVAFTVGPVDEIGWAFRKEDRDLQQAVARFFETQKAHEQSAFNVAWSRHFGISLNKFIALMNATP